MLHRSVIYCLIYVSFAYIYIYLYTILYSTQEKELKEKEKEKKVQVKSINEDGEDLPDLDDFDVQAITLMQARIRGFQARKDYDTMKKSVNPIRYR